MPPNQNNSYDFIMNPQKPQRRGFGFQGPQRILVIVGLACVGLIVLIIGLSVIFPEGTDNNDLKQVRAYQTELDRVIKLGKDELRDPATRQRLTTLEAALITDEFEVADLLSSRSVSVTKVELSGAKNSEIDASLEAASQPDEFDSAYLSAVSSVTSDYYRSLQQSLATASTNTEARILQTAMNNVELTAQQN